MLYGRFSFFRPGNGNTSGHCFSGCFHLRFLRLLFFNRSRFCLEFLLLYRSLLFFSFFLLRCFLLSCLLFLFFLSGFLQSSPAFFFLFFSLLFLKLGFSENFLVRFLFLYFYFNYSLSGAKSEKSPCLVLDHSVFDSVTGHAELNGSVGNRFLNCLSSKSYGFTHFKTPAFLLLPVLLIIIGNHIRLLGK